MPTIRLHIIRQYANTPINYTFRQNYTMAITLWGAGRDETITEEAGGNSYEDLTAGTRYVRLRHRNLILLFSDLLEGL